MRNLHLDKVITKQERANLVFYAKVKINSSEGILKPGIPADAVIR